MTAYLTPPDRDPIGRTRRPATTIRVDGAQLTGQAGQSIAAILLGNGWAHWRRTSHEGRPRGVFCGIGVCFDCLVTVNGQRDVRACLRRAQDGDIITSQHDELPSRPEDRSEGAADA